MNFLKKKIKHAVHGKHKDDDDDDDFDNYIPKVPPHPSTLIEAGKPTDPNTVISESTLPSLNSITNAADSAARSILSNIINTDSKTTSTTTAEASSDSGEKLSLEELKAREEEYKRAEKEKLKQQEESKKDCAEWKYFLSLTAKVEAVTSKTQSVLNKLKDESAVKEISKIEDPCFQDKYDEFAPKAAGSWVAFEEQAEYNPADPIFNQPPKTEEKSETSTESPVVDETTKKLAKELIDDFGFTNPQLGISVLETENLATDFDTEVDPFDTSFVDIEAIKSGKSVKAIELLQNLEISEADPFDTSHIESVINQDSVIGQSEKSYISYVHLDSIMSNPFLVDLDDSYTPYASGTHTPYSGTATPKRRNSTNPFEVLSPDSEEPIFVSDTLQSADEINNNENDTTTTNVASAIADMTADFYQSISMKPYDFDTTVNNEVFDDGGGASGNTQTTAVEQQYEDEPNQTKPLKTVTTINYDDNGGVVFDPFETIHDDDGLSSKRSSIGRDGTEPESPQVVLSSKAKELFNSSMASIELIAAAKVAQPAGDFSPLTPTTPLSNCENAFLSAPQGADIYSSDMSDVSDISPTAANDIRSAFDIYSGLDKDDITSFEPIGNSRILQSKMSLTKNDEEDDDVNFALKLTASNQYSDSTTTSSSLKQNDPKEEPITKENETCERPKIGHKHLEEALSSSIDINDVGNPNVNAEGIVNDAFEDKDREPVIDGSEPLERKRSIEIIEVNADNVLPNNLRDLLHNRDATEEEEEMDTKESDSTLVHNVSENVLVDDDDDDKKGQSADPFDTSVYDSKAFDAFESRFEATEVHKGASHGDDPFASPYKSAKPVDSDKNGFDSFEPFIPKQPENTPFKVAKPKKDSFEDSDDSDDSEEEENIRIVIRAKMNDGGSSAASTVIAPLLPPPPKSPRHLPQPVEAEEEPVNEEDMILMSYKTSGGKIKGKSTAKSFIDDEFDRFFSNEENRVPNEGVVSEDGEPEWPTVFGEAAFKRTTAGTESPASPQTPLYDEDTSQPLEDFPPRYLGDGWEMMLRHPAKKKLTANRYWKKVFVRYIPESCLLQLFNKKGDPQPFQELPLQASYSLSEISTQQYDQYGKIFTIKVQYIFYRERVGVRPGQIAKVMQGQIQSMGDFARLGMPVEHAPQVSELLKLGTLEYADLKELVQVVEESMFRMSVHRDRSLTYRTEEIQCLVQDELYVEQNKLGIVEKQLARVRIFFLAFINGMPSIEVGVNDLRRQGKEVVGRHDILPVVTEEWIRVEASEFHSCVQADVFDTCQVIKLIPPDACHFEMMRFRIRPPKNRELPLQVTANMNITPSKMELKCDILVPGCISRKHGQIPCEEIQIRFHIPECWIYFFRVEKHFRYGAVHSTNRRSGKLKGLDRILGTAANPEQQLIEVTAGLAKYEHAYHSIVWRIPRLPKDGQGAYTQQLMLVRLPLSSFDRIPESFYDYVHVEFHMPSTTVSHTTLRSISVNTENPPEKFVRYLAKYEYKIGLNITYDDTKPDLDYVASVALNNGSVKSGEYEPNSSEEEDNNKEEDY